MKELTHEYWMKNPTPRMMWVWDDDETCKGKMKVLCISKQGVTYPVIAIADNDLDVCKYKHCAEIEKQRRMTNKELSRWLRGNPTREFKCGRQSDGVCNNYTYYDSESNKEVNPELVVRENDGEWREPFVEEE